METARTDAESGPLIDEFHRLLMVFAANPFFTMALSPIYQMLQESRQPATPGHTRDTSVAEHRALAEAVKRQDEEAAFELARTHVNCVEARNVDYREFTAHVAGTNRRRARQAGYLYGCRATKSPNGDKLRVRSESGDKKWTVSVGKCYRQARIRSSARDG